MFANESASKSAVADDRSSWKVLIVDDEPLVHQVTKSVLAKETIDGRKIMFISAFSAKEAFEILAQNSDIAVIFLDVVMETEDAGLTLCKAH